MAAEVEYLSAQLWQLPLMQQALDESEASGHTCADEHCSGEGHREAAEAAQQQGAPGSGGSGFSDSDEQRRLALMVDQLR